jgi:hypothetical protein
MKTALKTRKLISNMARFFLASFLTCYPKILRTYKQALIVFDLTNYLQHKLYIRFL